ncbi:MAG: hypothetical protein MZV70_43425 [Desulfobacterales bacterium]|nr:hypothetical protein [Desulfobacterales bacterium]
MAGAASACSPSRAPWSGLVRISVHTTDFIPPVKNGQPASQVTSDKTWTTFEMELLISHTLKETRPTLKDPPVPTQNPRRG